MEIPRRSCVTHTSNWISRRRAAILSVSGILQESRRLGCSWCPNQLFGAMNERMKKAKTKNSSSSLTMAHSTQAVLPSYPTNRICSDEILLIVHIWHQVTSICCVIWSNTWRESIFRMLIRWRKKPLTSLFSLNSTELNGCYICVLWQISRDRLSVNNCKCLKKRLADYRALVVNIPVCLFIWKKKHLKMTNAKFLM